MKEQIKIALVDDHILVRNGIKSLLEEEQDIHIVAEGSNGLEAIEIVKKIQPDILIIDVRMPEMNGIEAVNKLKSLGSATKNIVLSMHDSENYILESIQAGANGYLLKDTDKKEFIKAIHTVHNGGKYFSGDISNILVNNLIKQSPVLDKEKIKQSKREELNLTKKEREILKLILLGKTSKEISEKLSKSKRTIETHRFNLMKKLKVKNSIELAAKVKEIGFSHEG